MAGLSIVAGIGPRVTLNGKEYQVRGKTNRFFAEVQAEIRKLRGNPFEMIIEAGVQAKLRSDPDLLNNVAEAVADKFRNWNLVRYGDYLDFINSAEGDIYTVYHCLRQDDSSITLDDVRDYIVNMKFKAFSKPEAKKEIDDLDAAIAEASGEVQPGNSNGQTPSTVTTGT